MTEVVNFGPRAFFDVAGAALYVNTVQNHLAPWAVWLMRRFLKHVENISFASRGYGDVSRGFGCGAFLEIRLQTFIACRVAGVAHV